MSTQLMTLKDLKISLDKHKITGKDPEKTDKNNGTNVDVSIACNIVDSMFNQISRCLQQDRSRIKVNVLTKGVVIGLLGDRTKNGMKDYIENMFDDDIKDLLDDIQKELDRRTLK